MGAKKGRCAAVITAVLLMASCISPPSCGLSQVETMAGNYRWDTTISGAYGTTPIDVFRDQLPPDVVTRWEPPFEEFRATFPDGSSLRIHTTSCFDDELGLCVGVMFVDESAADIDTRPPGVSPPAPERPTARAAEDSPNLARADRRRSAEPAAPRLAANTDARAPGASPPAAERPTARAAEDSLNLARADRRRIQAGLTASGLESGPADGMFGAGTRSAIRDWQAGRGLPATGYLNAAEAEELIALGRGSGEGRRAEAPRPSAVVEPVRVGGNISPPTKTRDVQPRYPEVARAARVQGVVILEATIGSTGVVTDVSVLRSVPLLDDAAIAAVLQWQYTPTLLNGVPVPVIMTVTVNFYTEG